MHPFVTLMIMPWLQANAEIFKLLAGKTKRRIQEHQDIQMLRHLGVIPQ